MICLTKKSSKFLFYNFIDYLNKRGQPMQKVRHTITSEDKRGHCTKNHIFFFQMFWKDISCIIRKDDIFFPENMILFFRRKMKDDLSQKTTWKYDTFFKCSKKIVFPKTPHWNFIVSSGKMAFLFLENMIFFLGCKWKMIFLKKYMEIWCSLYIRYRWCFFFLQTWNYPSVKKTKIIFSRKCT